MTKKKCPNRIPKLYSNNPYTLIRRQILTLIVFVLNAGPLTAIHMMKLKSWMSVMMTMLLTIVFKIVLSVLLIMKVMMMVKRMAVMLTMIIKRVTKKCCCLVFNAYRCVEHAFADWLLDCSWSLWGNWKNTK